MNTATRGGGLGEATSTLPEGEGKWRRSGGACSRPGNSHRRSRCCPSSSRPPAGGEVGRRGARARPGPRGVGGGGGTSDWVSFHDEEERREEDEDKRRREVRASEWDNEFAFRATTFGQELFKRVDGLIGQLSRTIIREFSLVDVPEETVSLLLRGVLVIAALSALKLLLGLFLGIAVLGFAGIFAYRYLYGLASKSNGDEDFGDEGYGGSGPRRGSNSDDVLDVNFYD
ncbi:hypothetical protein HOP50_02g18850 [Chloropicon primus]|uniref:Uncharacterized protein n=1 Tax=Chloropicon primus TaxID=1764295 RepID=A0A5B8MG31_9CHLO|nr:hypothetical protein A3770_02p18870 [Chloropicon primus]UPQ98579.1 hypothetical protein HOP50_02g18850 [Chloropicon primus]|eukprot:QDZ19369.1 hypothetical protein A3770_02p18870 [Chloropicon primus]